MHPATGRVNHDREGSQHPEGFAPDTVPTRHATGALILAVLLVLLLR